MKQDTGPTENTSSPQGFALIDLLLGFAIILYLLVNLAQVMILAQSSRNRYRDHVLASGFISDKLSEFRSLPFEHTELQTGNYTKECQDPDSERIFVVSWTISDISADLKSVIITSSRKEDSRPGIGTSLYISKELGF